MTTLYSDQRSSDALLAPGSARLLGAADPSLTTHLARYG